jgi:hypothetical protein
MTSATKKAFTPQDTQRLLTWMKERQPKVYAGLVRRFTPAGQGPMAGIWDSITTAASSITSSVTNFLNSEGAAKLFTAATPFMQTELEKKQLALNLQRIQSGLPPQMYPTLPGATSMQPYGSMPTSWQEPQQPIPWGWIGGGAAAIALLLLTRR